MKLLKIILLVMPYWLITSPVNAQTPTHPYMLFTSSQIANLQNKASQSPWKEMKTKANCDCLGGNPSNSSCSELVFKCWDEQCPTQCFGSGEGQCPTPGFVCWNCTNSPWDSPYYGWVMRDKVSACTLSYMLETNTTTKNNYLTKLVSTLKLWSGLVDYQQASFGWEQVVPVGAALVNSTLALDTIFFDSNFSASDKTLIEGYLQRSADTFASTINTNHDWSPNGAGTNLAWALYKHDSAKITQYTNLYKTGFLANLSPDGVDLEGIGYPLYRFGGIRDGKAALPAILYTATGSRALFDVPQIQNFYEWMYGYTTTPFGMYVTFGDSPAFYTMNSYDFNSHQSESANAITAHLYSDKAGKYAAWKTQAVNSYPGRLLQYVLLANEKNNLSTPEAPPSRIFPSGGAFFQEKNIQPTSLYGALWNSTSASWHSHKDINAIYIAGYGEPLLVNSGYNGGSNECLGFSWNYINNRAVSNNTALINYTIGNPQDPSETNDHSPNGADYFNTCTGSYGIDGKKGIGITEGFTGNGYFDYASGETVYNSPDCTDTLPNGKHIRNFVFIQPQDGKNGYFVTFDEIAATNGNSSTKINLAFHPNSDNSTLHTITTNTEYEAGVGLYRKIAPPAGVTTAGLDIFLATAPTSVALTDGVVAYWDPFPQDEMYKPFIAKYLFNTYAASVNGTKNIVTVLFPYDITHPKSIMARISDSGFSGATINHGSNIVDSVYEASTNSLVSHNSISFQGLASLNRKIDNQVSLYFVRKGKMFSDGNTVRRGFESVSPVSLFLKDNIGQIISPGTQITLYYPGIIGLKLNGQAVSGSESLNNFTTIIPKGTHNLELITTTPDYRTFVNFLPTFNLSTTIFDFNQILKLIFR